VNSWLALVDRPTGELCAAASDGTRRWWLAAWIGSQGRPHPGARRVDRRVLDPDGPSATASLLWLEDGQMPLFDDPAVVQARRAARARRSPRCVSTLTVDDRHFAGSLWVPARDGRTDDDPFWIVRRPRLLSVAAGLLACSAALTGPAQERYAGAPWPSGAFR
jgi:hypothetical protein